MLVKRLMVLVMLVLLGASPKPDKSPTKVPAKLEPFVELSRLCSEYEKQVTVVRWQEVWRQTFDAATAQKWATPAEAAAAPDPNGLDRRNVVRKAMPTVTVERVDDRECAVLDATDLQDAYFPIGDGPVRGEFAIEFVGKAMSERPCDLSIFCLAGTQPGPAFQFGGRRNRSNLIRTVNNEGVIVSNTLPRTPLIEQDRWYTVRLEIRNGKTTASLDGKAIGSAPAKIDQRAWTPMIYIFQSKIAVDEAKIETMAPSASTADPAVTFVKVFGQQSREAVMAQVAKLVELLDDGDPRVREAAHQLLKPMGTLTRDALREAIDAGSAEQAGRAQQLMDLLPSTTARVAD